MTENTAIAVADRPGTVPFRLTRIVLDEHEQVAAVKARVTSGAYMVLSALAGRDLPLKSDPDAYERSRPIPAALVRATLRTTAIVTIDTGTVIDLWRKTGASSDEGVQASIYRSLIQVMNLINPD